MNKRQVPAHLKQVSSRKGKKQTPAQLSARKSRVELTLKQKCEIIDESKKRGFKIFIVCSNQYTAVVFTIKW